MLKTQVSGHCSNICQHWKTIEHGWSLNFFSQPKPHSQMGTGTVVVLNTVSLISSGTLWKHLLYLCISAQLCWWQLQYWLQHRMVRVLGLSERQILYAKSCRHLPTLENKWACWSLNCFSQPKPHSQLGTGTVVILNTVSLISSGTLRTHLLYLCISAQLCWWQLQYWLQHWLRCWLQYWLQRRMVRSPSGHWERPSRYGLIPCAKVWSWSLNSGLEGILNQFWIIFLPWMLAHHSLLMLTSDHEFTQFNSS